VARHHNYSELVILQLRSLIVNRRRRGTEQNAAHLLQYTGVGGGNGRIKEEIYKDPDWCRAVADIFQP